VVGLIAAQALVPLDLRARHCCESLWLSVEVDMEPEKASRLAEKLRMMASIRAVILTSFPGT
jgi:hypothetical protein